MSKFGKLNKDNFAEMLRETDEMFTQSHNVSIVGQDFASVLSDNTLFETYKDAMVEGFSNADEVEMILENSRTEMLNESSMTGIQPFASLTMPILVKLWARLSMTEAIPTEPTNTPAFTVPFFKPFVMDKDGNKFYLPESINGVPENIVELKRLPAEISLTGGKLSAHDLFTYQSGAKEGESVAKRDIDTVDRKFRIVKATWSDSFNVQEAAAGEVELRSSRITLDSDNRLYGEVKYPTNADGEVEEDTILGSVDLESGELTLV